MTHFLQDRRRQFAIFILAVTTAIGGFVLFAGKAERPEFAAASQSALRVPDGDAQLVSVEPLPATDGDMCEWIPASTQTRLVAALRQERLSARAATEASADTEERTAVDADRAPVRIIKDTYPTYSAVAVDPVRNEIVLQDENLFNIMVYDRMASTPPGASMTEPKRMIGGKNTKVEFNCGLYIDPKTGDIYSVNNDTIDTMVVFSRDARGNVAPDRELETPHRSYGIAVDEEAQELYLTVEHPPQVLVYRKAAQGDEKPLRVLEGQNTRLEDAHGIAVDTKNHLIFVANHGHASNPRVPGGGRFDPPSITVYPLQASGDNPPLRIITGPKTQLNWPAHIYFDQEHQELFVANDVGDSILVFRATDSGDVAPTRVLGGLHTGLKNPVGIFVESKNQELVVANMGNHSATVYPRAANGDVAPLRTIRSAPPGKLALAIGNPGAAAYDSKRDEILVPN